MLTVFSKKKRADFFYDPFLRKANTTHRHLALEGWVIKVREKTNK